MKKQSQWQSQSFVLNSFKLYKENCENIHVLKKEEKSVFEFKQFIR